MTMTNRERTSVRAAIEKLNLVPTQTAYSWAVRDARDLLRDIDGVMTTTYATQLPVPEGDSLSKLLADMDEWAARKVLGPGNTTYDWATRLRAMMENDGVEPEGVDVVNGVDAQSLPVGSIVIRCEWNGTPLTDAYAPSTVTTSGPAGKTTSIHYRVLYRAPVAPLTVGEEITETSRLDRAKPGTVIRFPVHPFGVYRRNDDNTWDGISGARGIESGGLRVDQGPVVLYVPEEG